MAIAQLAGNSAGVGIVPIGACLYAGAIASVEGRVTRVAAGQAARTGGAGKRTLLAWGSAVRRDSCIDIAGDQLVLVAQLDGEAITIHKVPSLRREAD